MRLVLDTNVVAAGLLWQGPPHQLLQRAFDGAFELAVSPALLDELEGVLGRKKFSARIAAQGFPVKELVLRYAELARMVQPAPIAPVVLEDPDDDNVLACAVGAKADAIVSGDSHLLKLKAYRGIAILTAAQALERVPER